MATAVVDRRSLHMLTERLRELDHEELDALCDAIDVGTPDPTDDEHEKEEALHGVVRDLLECIRPDAARAARLARAAVPRLFDMRGARVDAAKARALLAMGVDPLTTCLLGDMVKRIEIRVMDDEREIVVEAHAIGQVAAGGAAQRVAIEIGTDKMKWDPFGVVVRDRNLPDTVIAAMTDGRPIEDLVEHPLLRGSGLVARGLQNQWQDLRILTDTGDERTSDQLVAMIADHVNERNTA